MCGVFVALCVDSLLKSAGVVIFYKKSVGIAFSEQPSVLRNPFLDFVGFIYVRDCSLS